MEHRTRVAVVTAGLVVAGGVFGTIAGTLVLTAWLAVAGVESSLPNLLRETLFFGIFFGGAMGAVVGPLGAWMLMRDVPLWLAVGGTTLATTATGGLGMIISGQPALGILAGLLGFTASAAGLQRRFRDPSAAAVSHLQESR